MCSFKQVCKVDLGSSLYLGGMTLWCGKDHGCTTILLLLIEASMGFLQVYHIMHFLCHCQT
jgi:hypothetical protein